MLSKASVVEDLAHRQYQVLVYRNGVLKTMLTGSTTPSIPSGFSAPFFDPLSPLSWSLEYTT